MTRLNNWEILERFKFATLLDLDWKGWWFFMWPTSQWTAESITEKLEAHGILTRVKRNRKGEVVEAWQVKPITKDELEALFLTKERIDFLKRFHRLEVK